MDGPYGVAALPSPRLSSNESQNENSSNSSRFVDSDSPVSIAGKKTTRPVDDVYSTTITYFLLVSFQLLPKKKRIIEESAALKKRQKFTSFL